MRGGWDPFGVSLFFLTGNLLPGCGASHLAGSFRSLRSLKMLFFPEITLWGL